MQKAEAEAACRYPPPGAPTPAPSLWLRADPPTPAYTHTARKRGGRGGVTCYHLRSRERQGDGGGTLSWRKSAWLLSCYF
jgi:hypothetical protein